MFTLPDILVRQNVFTPQDDEQLLALVKRYGRHWSTFKKHFNDRFTPEQLRNRYFYHTKGYVQKEWSIEELERLINLVNKYGRKWSYFADNYFLDRSPVSIKRKYDQFLLKKFDKMCLKPPSVTHKPVLTEQTTSPEPELEPESLEDLPLYDDFDFDTFTVE